MQQTVLVTKLRKHQRPAGCKSNSLSFQYLRRLSRFLPSPDAIEYINNATYTIYKAKAVYTSTWQHTFLRRFVIETRKSYQEYYGDEINTIDTYDDKAAVYLTKVTYTEPSESNTGKKGIPVIKWYSLRFVPGASEPISTEDMDFYVYSYQGEKIPILNLLQKNFANLLGKHPLDNIVTISRFCSLPHYPAEQQYDNYDSSSQNTKHVGYYPGISFALMNKYFIKDAIINSLPFTIITAQMHTSLISSVLRLPYKNKGKVLPFHKASTLTATQKEKIFLNREKSGVYVHQFPGYFFEIKHLLKLFRSLIRKGLLSESTLKRYLDKSVSVEQFFSQPHVKNFRHIGKLLNKKGLIPESVVTGEELRELVKLYVQDGPTLYIMKVHSWVYEISVMLEKSKQYMYSGFDKEHRYTV